MLLLFTIKPAIDLTWNIPIFSMGGRGFSLLHITGVFVFIYFGRYLLTNLRISAPYSGIFKIFILINCISIIATLFIDKVSLIQVIDLMLRILDSYIIYNVAYIAAKDTTFDNSRNLVRAVSIGTFIAVMMNFIAIKMGYGGLQYASNDTYREHGLYHDPGTLSNIAMYNVVFTSYLLHLLV